MEDRITYNIHLKSLGQIKKRPNQYPTYEYNNKCNNKNSYNKEINSLKTEIKKNNKNIASVKNNLNAKKKKKYNNDQYLNDIEDIQRQMLNGLINKNNKLKTELKNLKNINEV